MLGQINNQIYNRNHLNIPHYNIMLTFQQLNFKKYAVDHLTLRRDKST